RRSSRNASRWLAAVHRPMRVGLVFHELATFFFVRAGANASSHFVTVACEDSRSEAGPVRASGNSDDFLVFRDLSKMFLDVQSFRIALGRFDVQVRRKRSPVGDFAGRSNVEYANAAWLRKQCIDLGLVQLLKGFRRFGLLREALLLHDGDAGSEQYK